MHKLLLTLTLQFAANLYARLGFAQSRYIPPAARSEERLKSDLYIAREYGSEGRVA